MKNPRYKVLVCACSASISVHDTHHPEYKEKSDICNSTGASYPWAVAHWRGAYSESRQTYYTPFTSRKKAHALCTLLNGGTY